MPTSACVRRLAVVSSAAFAVGAVLLASGCTCKSCVFSGKSARCTPGGECEVVTTEVTPDATRTHATSQPAENPSPALGAVR